MLPDLSPPAIAIPATKQDSVLTEASPTPTSQEQHQPNSLTEMRRVLYDAALRLDIAEGSIAHEQLAGRVLQFFESGQGSLETFAADAGQLPFEPLGRQDKRALVQLGAAVVLLWKRLPPPMRDDVLRAASSLEGIEIAPDTTQRLRRMIEDHTGWRQAG